MCIRDSNKSQSAGYPDKELKGLYPAYIEVKICKIGSEESSFRSFYLSTFNKITKNNPHILVCFPHKDKKLYLEHKPKIIDLYNLQLELKAEYNANNKILYK